MKSVSITTYSRKGSTTGHPVYLCDALSTEFPRVVFSGVKVNLPANTKHELSLILCYVEYIALFFLQTAAIFLSDIDQSVSLTFLL